MLNKKKLQRSAAQTTQYILEDFELLLETKDIPTMRAHPEFQEACEIIAEYRHKSPSTIEIRILRLNDLINGKAYESIWQATCQYFAGAIKGGFLSEGQILKCAEAGIQ